MITEKTFLDIRETANALKLSMSTIRTLIRKGELKAEKLTNKMFIHCQEIERFLEEKKKSMVNH